jgi:hypothetical protein
VEKVALPRYQAFESGFYRVDEKHQLPAQEQGVRHKVFYCVVRAAAEDPNRLPFLAPVGDELPLVRRSEAGQRFDELDRIGSVAGTGRDAEVVGIEGDAHGTVFRSKNTIFKAGRRRFIAGLDYAAFWNRRKVFMFRKMIFLFI